MDELDHMIEKQAESNVRQWDMELERRTRAAMIEMRKARPDLVEHLDDFALGCCLSQASGMSCAYRQILGA